MSEAPETLDGWYALHDIRKIDWPVWKSLLPEERRDAVNEAGKLLERYDALGGEDGSSAVFSMLGHKGDLMFLHLRPTLQGLREVELDLDKSHFADVLVPAYSYVSVTELSRYAEGARGGNVEDPEANRYIQSRLHFHVPDNSHVCFYPMDKKKGEQENWYTLSMEERRELMHSHGLTGRKYAGKVTQMITGSMGLDDWEWGVTLFADDPLQFKKLVYEMRFDEVSSRFGLFGTFFVGMRLRADQLPDLMAV